MDASVVASVLPAAQALALASARWMGCALLLPLLARRHLPAMMRASVCLALALPQARVLWPQLVEQPPTLPYLLLVGLKEVALGALLGALLAWPFWAFVGAFTLVDNQRGANLAQLVNPSIQPDASLLGELAERVLIVLIIDAGLLLPALEIVGRSHAVWPALTLWPGAGGPTGLTTALPALAGGLMGSVLAYALPFLLLLIVLELAFAVSSLVVKGLDVYQAAMPLRSLLALAAIALAAGLLLPRAVESVELAWQAVAVGWRPGT